MHLIEVVLAKNDPCTVRAALGSGVLYLLLLGLKHIMEDAREGPLDPVLFELSESLFSLVLLGSKLSVAGIFVLSLSLQIRLVGELTVKVSLERLSLDHES